MPFTPRTCALILLLSLGLGAAGLQAQEGLPDDGSSAAEAKPAAPWPTKKWPRSLPDKQGLDGAALHQLVELIEAGEEFPDLHGLLVVRHGYLVLEEYFDGNEADDLHMLQSVSKSFTSALVGIAIEQKKLKGVEERVLDFFGDDKEIENLDDRKRAITVEDLLTMRSGNDYHERGPDSPHWELNSLSKGWTEFVLNRPMVTDPGTTFQYDSGAVVLTSTLLKLRTGDHADAYAKKHLFKPLGIERYYWYANAEGHPHTGGGLNLRPRDMAKLGLLYLRQGKWEDEQVVPASWVEASTKKHHEFPSEDELPFSGYGYWWWILPPAGDRGDELDIYAACGFMAQYIFVIPEHDLVVVVTGGTQNQKDMMKPIGMLYSHLLPTVR